MNINPAFDRASLVANLNNILEMPTLTVSTQMPFDLAEFLEKNYELMIKQQDDPELHNLLYKLRERVVKEFRNEDKKGLTPEGEKLVDKLITISNKVFSPSLEELPDDVMEKILTKVPTRKSEMRLAPETKTPIRNSGLRAAAQASKTLSRQAAAAKRTWATEEIASLKTFNCKTAAEAVDYIIANKLKTANLSDFPDLTDADLNRLIDQCPFLTKLFISSYDVTNEGLKNVGNLFGLETIEVQANALQALDLSKCSKLQHLVLTWCASLVELKLPEQMSERASDLKTIKLEGCQNLNKLPIPANAFNLEKIHCQGCESLMEIEFPTNIPKLQDLFLYGCGVKELRMPANAPELEKIVFAISRYVNKATFPLTAPNLETINLDHNSRMQFLALPDHAPKLSMVQCEGCRSLRADNVVNFANHASVIRGIQPERLS
jgi:hypothetical protein